MTTSPKRIEVDPAESTGSPPLGHVARVVHLPDEVWARVVKWWPGNYDLVWVLAMRRLCRAFATALRHRVMAHTPDTARFIRELRLMRTFITRRSPLGQRAYGRALVMIYSRFFERVPKVTGAAWEAWRTVYHSQLIDWMEARSELMPDEFDGFVARLQHCWARHYLPVHKFCDFEETFKRIRNGERGGVAGGLCRSAAEPENGGSSSDEDE